jgi:glycosyltransferase involved in cell wall biosynthesis
MQFLGLTDGSLEDAPVVAGKGDIFWGIDLTSDILPAHEATLNLWREHGVRIVFTVHDLIPIYFPHTCDIGIVNAHVRWLESLARVASGLLCTTHKVAENCIEWLSAYQPQTERPIGIGWVPLGADVLNEDGKSLQSSPEQARQLAAIARSPSFLMVGTLEPRKAYAQALAAFELLWRQDRQVNLVIVGKKGWNIEDLAVQLQSHPERERRLFWLQGIEDGFLEQLYKQSVCLLAASLDEGFGLPLVEAARHGLPVLARDIPVFHEVTAGQASYFSGLAPEDIADAVEAWLANHAQGLSPHGPGTPWLSWAEATQQMLRMVLEDGWQMQWNPDKQAAAGVVARYWGSDPRLHTAVGERRGRALLSSGRQGHLLYGPYLSLKPGRYDAVIHGTLGPFGVEGGAVADVSAEGGKALLVERIIRAGEPNVLARLPFTLRETAQGVEVRVFVDEQSDLSITGVDILQAKGETPEPPAHLAGEPLLIKRYWATHPAMASAMGYRQGRSLHTVARAGHLLHGPYISLPAGCYRANLFGEVQEWGRAEVDVVSDKGRCFHDIKELVTNEVGEGIIASIEFALDSYTTDLEVRLLVAEESRIRVDGIVLSELEPSRATAISEPTMKNKNNLTRELRDVV